MYRYVFFTRSLWNSWTKLTLSFVGLKCIYSIYSIYSIFQEFQSRVQALFSSSWVKLSARVSLKCCREDSIISELPWKLSSSVTMRIRSRPGTIKRAPNLAPRTFSVFLKTLFTGYKYLRSWPQFILDRFSSNFV